MKLTNEENEILLGKQGKTLQKCMKTLVKYGDFYGADIMHPIKSAHIVLGSVPKLMEIYLTFLKKLVNENIKVKIPTTTNPQYIIDDVDIFDNIMQYFAINNQKKIKDLYEKIGAEDNYSCTPYLSENIPKCGDIVAWAESNAVIYINSIIGARTNRNSAMIDLISAVLGITPNFGLLKDENRLADYKIVINIDGEIDFPLLGYLIGEKIIDKVSYIVNLSGRNDDFKNMGAAMSASGGIGLYHIDGITPEAIKHKEKLLKENFKTITITKEMILNLKKRLSEGKKKSNFIFIGCPHLSLDELIQIAKLIDGNRVKTKLWINSNQNIINQFKETKYYEILHNTGAKLISVCPITNFKSPNIGKIRKIFTNSGKMRFYSKSYYGTLEECLKEAIGGEINEI